MPLKHPIVAVTGAHGAGLSTVRHAFKTVFRRLEIKAAIVHGDAFHRYTEREFAAQLEQARASGRHISWFGPECNHFAELEAFFKSYSETGNGLAREYAHDADRAAELGVPVGEFTPWQPLKDGGDLLFYEGQHGGVVAQTWTRRKVDSRHFPTGIDRRVNARGIDAAQYVDLLIGVVPAINLEWIQKIHRDCGRGHCSAEESVDTILRRLDDYIHYIIPQFGLTDINIQRIPLVDTSNPFIARDVPSEDESALVVHFRDRGRYDFVDLLKRIPGSRMTRPTTMMIPGGALSHALEVICAPILADLIEKRRATAAGV
ncbi:MAG: phosphoribulokinase [Gammaproteobacteria bacterium]|nr:phosphoribulokinase [Gammaproteobacteria bacterium]